MKAVSGFGSRSALAKNRCFFQPKYTVIKRDQLAEINPNAAAGFNPCVSITSILAPRSESIRLNSRWNLRESKTFRNKLKAFQRSPGEKLSKKSLKRKII